AIVLFQEFSGVFDVGIGNSPPFRQEIDMRKRSGWLRSDNAGDWRELNWHFIKNKYFVEPNLNMFVKLVDDVNGTQALRQIQGLISLLFSNVTLQHALNTGKVL